MYYCIDKYHIRYLKKKTASFIKIKSRLSDKGKSVTQTWFNYLKEPILVLNSSVIVAFRILSYFQIFPDVLQKFCL
jgi:hypothetical protein